MKLTIKSHANIAVVSIEGSVLQEDIVGFKNALAEQVEQSLNMIILDMEKTSYICSLCLAVILEYKKKLSHLRGDLKIACPNNLITKLLETTRLLEKFDVSPDIEGAMQRCRG